MQDKEIESIRHRLEILRLEHRDLDDIVHRLQADPLSDRLQLQRFKKRKLQLKDIIQTLEDELIPDLNA